MKRQAVLFISHGAPTFAMAPGQLGPLLTAAGKALTRPRAIVVISPHWMTKDIGVTTTAHPETMHDFSGFPAALYGIRYPAPGAPELAQAVIAQLQGAGWTVHADPLRGLDHGAWVPLTYLFPEATVPVIQISMPHHLDSQSAYALGQSLCALRDKGLLIIGSGSMTHNLYEVQFNSTQAVRYAAEFANWIKDTVCSHDHASLIQALTLAPHALRAHPSTEHFLPLLVAAGAAGPASAVTLLDGGIEHGVLSMDSYVFN